MINQVFLQDFKSFSEPAIANLNDLVVIAGPNSGGKTTLIQALLLLSQTLRNPRQEVALDLGGTYIQFAEFRETVFGRPLNIKARFTVGFNITTTENDLIALLSQDDLGTALFDRFVGIGQSRLPWRFLGKTQTDYNTECRITFGATRTGKPIVYSLLFEKRLNTDLAVRYEIEMSGRKYRATVKSISTNKPDESEIASTASELSENVAEIARLASSATDGTSLASRRSLAAFLRGVLQPYGIDWDRLPEGLASPKKEIEAVILPVGRKWSNEMTRAVSRLAIRLLEFVSRIEFERSALLSLTLDHFLPNPSIIYVGREIDPRWEEYLQTFNVLFSSVTKEIKTYLRTFEYIGPLRAKPERVYLSTGTPPDVGSSGENAIPILWLEQSERIFTKTKSGQEPVLRRMDQAVREWFEEFGIAQSLHVTRPKRVIYQAELDGPPGSETKVTIADVGFGVSQLLPVIVAGLRAPANSTVIFEQPEIHLHPRLQAKLADFFICLMELNKRVIVETHSEHLINMLRLRIVEDSKGELQKRIGILFVQAYTDGAGEPQHVAAKGRGSYVSNLQVDKYGQVINWPPDFFPEYGDLNERILRAIMSRHKKENV